MNRNNIKQLLSEISPPFQPEMVQGEYVTDVRWKISEWNDASMKNLACFYQFRTLNTVDGINMFPDNCIKFLFECNPDADASKAKLIGINTEKTTIQLSPDTKYFVFMPYSHLGLNLEISHFDLLNINTDIENALPKGSSLIKCQEQINAKNSFEANIDTIIKNASNSIDRRYTTGISEYLALAMCLSSGNLDAKDIEKFTGYSGRHCRDRFKDSYGFSPKKYCRIVRFQGAMHELIASYNKGTLDIVSDHGYFDQAHFIKDFKQFTSLSPSEFKHMHFGKNYGVNIGLYNSEHKIPR